MEGVFMRNVQPTDYEPVIRVLNLWWDGRDMTDMLPRLFFAHFQGTSFVAEHQGKIVGFIIGFVSQTLQHDAYVHFVGVAPDFRRNGLGRLLYDQFFLTVTKLGCTVVRCVTSPVNRSSVAFHLRLGFSTEPKASSDGGLPIAKDYDGVGEDRVLFVKRLVGR
jgi:ribosomal protein S18 acetylase RimI-like enzyme